jgi:4-amino-4-deoxy-L-arabinose transferase-like glycosyltransferase
VSGETKSSSGKLLFQCALVGTVLGLGMLTRYSFAFLVLPVVAFLVIWARPVRVAGPLIAVVVMLGLFSPWALRNIQVSGNPFGSAAYSVLEETSILPGEVLPRSLDFKAVLGPEGQASRLEVAALLTKEVARKTATNLREIVQKDVPRMGTSWVIAFFLPGLLLPFMNPSIGRLRWFLLMALPVVLVVHAGTRTFRTLETPDVNGDAFLILAVPMITVFGAGFFMVLLDQIILPFRQLRQVIQGFTVLLCSLGLVFHMLPPRTFPVAYPPYFPPLFSQIGQWMRTDELMMTDVPWAIAWYADRRAMWLTLDSNEDFYFVNDELKTVSLVYVTPRTLDSRFHSGMWKQPRGWGRFASDIVSKGEVPTGFPLRKIPRGFIDSGQLLFSDWERWTLPSQP